MRRIVILSGIALILLAAFAVAPALLVGNGLASVSGNAPLTHAFAVELTTFWNADASGVTPALADLIDLWRRWHALKVVISVLFTATTIALSATLWRQFLAPGVSARRRWVSGASAVATSMLILCGLVAIAANVQATAAPLSALLPLLPSDPLPGDLRRAMSQIRDGLTNADSAFADRPALAVMIDSQRTYLAALAAAATGSAIVCAGCAGYAARRLSRGLGIAGAVVTAAVVAAAVLAWMSVGDAVDSLLGVFTVG
ncbi:MAG: hypothetical protein PGN37_06835 [Mycobacterium kyogaense]|uniref:hypothetical protein n=1 Tax=Mycobacterium kyogaense TaxID=2212479 RepID=UPI002FF6E95C